MKESLTKAYTDRISKAYSRLICLAIGHIWYEEERKVLGNGWSVYTTGKYCTSCGGRE